MPNYIGFDHISRDDVILKRMTTFAREYLARGSNITAILLIDGTMSYIFRKSSRTKENHTVSIEVVHL